MNIMAVNYHYPVVKKNQITKTSCKRINFGNSYYERMEKLPKQGQIIKKEDIPEKWFIKDHWDKRVGVETMCSKYEEDLYLKEADDFWKGYAKVYTEFPHDMYGYPVGRDIGFFHFLDKNTVQFKSTLEEEDIGNICKSVESLNLARQRNLTQEYNYKEKLIKDTANETLDLLKPNSLILLKESNERYNYVFIQNIDETFHDKDTKEDTIKNFVHIKELINQRKLNDAIELYIDKENPINNRDIYNWPIVNELIKQDKLDDAIQFFIDKKNPENNDNIIYKTLIASELVKNGRLEEAKYINPFKTEEELILLQYGSLSSLDRKNKKIEIAQKNNSYQKYINNSKEKYKNVTPDKQFLDEKSFIGRVLWDIGTIFLAEVYNNDLKQTSISNKKTACNNSIIEDRSELINLMRKSFDLDLPLVEVPKEDISRIKAIEIKEEQIKSQINDKFVRYIEMFLKNKNVNEFPNCIMLVGQNIPYMQSIIDWIVWKTTCNYIKVPYNIDNEEMQEALGESLELAEEHYQKTGMRSIIYVNGMEKLLNPSKNSIGNIACMKEMMNTADKEYHSTIIFTAKNPSSLDPGTLVSHRVGLTIDVPITFEDIKFYLKEREVL